MSRMSIVLSNPFTPESFRRLRGTPTKRKDGRYHAKWRCNLCDMEKATKFRIPACRRPARWWIWDVMFNTVWRLQMCNYHYRQTFRL